MKINVFTIRNKSNNELIYAEGTSGYGEYCSFFELDGKWLTEEEKNREGWVEDYECLYTYTEEIRFLLHYDFEKIKFALEKIEIK